MLNDALLTSGVKKRPRSLGGIGLLEANTSG